MDINLLSYHGLYSQGNNLEILVNHLESDLEIKGVDVVTNQTDYPYLRVVSGLMPWSRKVVPLLFLESLAKERLKHPEAKIYGIFHSNATFGIWNALAEYTKNRNKYDLIKLDKIILLGCVIPRDADWSIYPDSEVINFVGTKDRVSGLATLFGMSNSGKKGFKINAPNLTQYYTRWKHSDFVLPENYEYIRDRIL